MARYKLTIIVDDVRTDRQAAALVESVRSEIAPDCTVVSATHEYIRETVDTPRTGVLASLAAGDRNG